MYKKILTKTASFFKRVKFESWLLLGYWLVIPFYEFYRWLSKEAFSISLLIQYLSSASIFHLINENIKLKKNVEATFNRLSEENIKIKEFVNIQEKISELVKQSLENQSKDRLAEIKKYENRYIKLEAKFETEITNLKEQNKELKEFILKLIEIYK